MKTLLVVRHAKSSDAKSGQRDFDRPLHARGEKDAMEMAEKIAGKILKIDRFVSSPARRASDTCTYFCKAFKTSASEIKYVQELYNADLTAFYDVVYHLDDNDDTVALFSHNPGITHFVNSLCAGFNIDNLPTCAVFAVQSEVLNWKDFKNTEREFIFMHYPKE
ncbi:MAG: hypothetical protein ABS68_08315 [Niastella sp. SCN 39-18]|nr:histidine phosphatase family protein [Sphingobacteriales bacterium]ODT52571.1 MAG: hypothetical protein ABS68_08315 [Niastella sp. SCN 39-18]OJW11711.1 MAG: hypothetical protein BGO53_12385 [Sphingobacteriales bacterium 39-19]